MKRLLFIPVLIMILSWSGVESAGLWTKYVAPDRSYSFHYPSGWRVETNESLVNVENKRTDEQLLMAAMPFDSRKSPAQLAAGFIDILRENGSPHVRASNWQSQPDTQASHVLFDLTDQSEGKDYQGMGVVIKSKTEANWFSYIAPTDGYSRTRGASILQGFIGSMASGTASKMPSLDYNADSSGTANSGIDIERNAQAFMFVLEFALGAPLTQAQERVILTELKNGWKSMTASELRKYDQYPVLVQKILKMGQKDLESLRSSLEQSIREWLDTTDSSDKSVKIIRDQLNQRGRVVIDGNPPLTEMSLTAYSEIITFSRLLQQNPKANPEQISPSSVNETKKQVLKAWSSFPIEDRRDIAMTPGLWICLRTLLREGPPADQMKIRDLLKKVEAGYGQTANSNSNGSSSGNKKPMNMTTHMCLMQMQQTTFNTYMWSRGFNYQPATGKMW